MEDRGGGRSGGVELMKEVREEVVGVEWWS